MISNLSSVDTLLRFVENNNKIDDFKNHLREKGISPANYFKGKFQKVLVMNQIVPNKYSLTYSKPLPAETFLNDYIIFVHQQTLAEIKKEIIQNILVQINLHEENLKMAELVGLQNPILQSNNEILINEPDALFYDGTKVLQQKIIHLNNLLTKAKNFKLDYNPILEKSSSSVSLLKPSIFYVTISFVFSLFLSFVGIYLKLIFKKNY
jgi:LPS O-antigen subunit length determinant protein (WzzB/FepE family)